MQIGFVQFAEAGDAEESETTDHFIFQQFQHPHDAGLARGGERPALQAADPDQIGAGGDRLYDVGATAERAIDHDLGAAGNGVDDFRQHMHRTAAVIELPSAMVRHIDPVHAVIERDGGVFRGGDALDAPAEFYTCP